MLIDFGGHGEVRIDLSRLVVGEDRGPGLVVVVALCPSGDDGGRGGCARRCHVMRATTDRNQNVASRRQAAIMAMVVVLGEPAVSSTVTGVGSIEALGPK